MTDTQAQIRALLPQFGSADEVLAFARTRPRAERVLLEQAAADLAGTLPSGPGPLASYYNRWSSFARDMIRWPKGQSLNGYQAEALDELCENKRLLLCGPHGIAKSSTASMALLAFALTRDEAGVDWKAGVTASVWHQLQAYFWPEVHKWVKLLDWEAIGRPQFKDRDELLQMALKLNHGEAFTASVGDAASIEGAHATSLMFVYDESKAIKDEVFDAVEGAFSNAGSDTNSEAFALALSTPGPPQGRFYQICKRAPGTEDWHVKRITKDMAVTAGRMSAEWADARARQWGVDSALYKNRVLGEFATSDTDGVIPLEWVEAAQDRWRTAFGHNGEDFTMGDPEWIGVDCSGSGADRTVLARRTGTVIAPLERPRKRSTEIGDEEMSTAGKIVGLLTAYPGCRAVIDAGGLGSGVVGRVREQVPNDQVVAFLAGAATDRKDATGEIGFADARAAAWWSLRELLSPDSGENVMLPPDDELTGDLTAPHWREVSGGKIRVEAKDDIRKRLGRSTDAADAVVQAFWSPDDAMYAAASFYAPGASREQVGPAIKFRAGRTRT